MKNTKLVLAVGAGYVLGRLNKARWALALAGLVAGKHLSSDGGELLEGLLDTSPQLRDLARTVRGELGDAGRKAVGAAAGRQIDALTDRLESRTSALRDVNQGRNQDDRAESEEPEHEERDEERTSAHRSGAGAKASSARSRSRTPPGRPRRPGPAQQTRPRGKLVTAPGERALSAAGDRAGEMTDRLLAGCLPHADVAHRPGAGEGKRT